MSRQFDVPTSLTPTLNHLLCFPFVVCTKEVINSINHPVVNLLDTRVGRTTTEVVPRTYQSETTCSRNPREIAPSGPVHYHRNERQKMSDRDQETRSHLCDESWFVPTNSSFNLGEGVTDFCLNCEENVVRWKRKSSLVDYTIWTPESAKNRSVMVWVVFNKSRHKWDGVCYVFTCVLLLKVGVSVVGTLR